MNWFYIAIFATIIYGGINFMYKLAAVHKLASHKILNKSATTVSLLSLVLVLITKSPFTEIYQILFFAIINSTFFGLGTISKIQSLKYIPTSYAFPITKMNSVFLIIFGIFIFHDKPNVNQWIGIVISISILAYISFNIKTEKLEIKDKKQQNIGFLLAILAALSTSISMLTGKFASSVVPKLNYIFISYTLVMIYTIIINKTYYKNAEISNKTHKNKTSLFGVIIGILNFAGYYLVLNAFEKGPLSLIQGINSNSFIIPIILSIIIFKEKFTYKNAIVVIWSVASVLLIK
jgi:drug/metabolite transporter (DMT)-like permease